MLEKRSEKQIEAKLRRKVIALGGLCLKFTSPGWAGVPDRIILLPGGRIAFAELKAPGRREAAEGRQRYTQELLRSLGFTVFSAVDSDEKIDEVLTYCMDAIHAAKINELRWRNGV